MKKSFIILVLLSIFVISCGKTGALYLPDEQQGQQDGSKNNETK